MHGVLASFTRWTVEKIGKHVLCVMELQGSESMKKGTLRMAKKG